MPDFPIDSVRSNLINAQKTIQQQHRALQQPDSIDHGAMIRLAQSISKLRQEVETIRNPSLTDDFALVSDDFDCLKIRVRVLAQKNRVSAKDAIFNQGQCRGIVGMIGSSLSFPQIATFNHVAKSCHAAKLQTVQNQLRVIRRLNVTNLDQYARALGKPNDWKAVLDLCENLQEFDFSKHNYEYLENARVRAIIPILPPSVIAVDLSATDIDCAILKKLADRLPKLASIELLSCDNLRKEGLTYLGRRCPNITTLHFGFTTSIWTIPSDCWLAFPNLRKLHIYGLPIDATTANHWNGLTHLTIHKARQLNSGIWQTITSACPNLQYFEISHGLYFREACADLLQNCPQLTVLKITQSKISFANLKDLLESPGRLKTLILSDIPLTQAEQITLKNSFPHIDIIIN